MEFFFVICKLSKAVKNKQKPTHVSFTYYFYIIRKHTYIQLVFIDIGFTIIFICRYISTTSLLLSLRRQKACGSKNLTYIHLSVFVHLVCVWRIFEIINNENKNTVGTTDKSQNNAHSAAAISTANESESVNILSDASYLQA